MAQQQNKTLRIGMVVGEVSGDTLGAALIKSFQAQGIHAVFEGIGGPQMQALGFNSIYPMERLAVMGLVEVMGRLKELFAIRDGLVNRWTENPVDIFVGIDAPDFNLRLSSQLKPLSIKTVQYVSPSVWAWRQGRVHGIRAAVDLVLCLFPFEVDFYKKHQVPAMFVGHPLAQQIPLHHDLIAAKQQLGLNPVQTMVGLLPGSRSGEVSRLAPLLFDGAVKLLQQHPEIQFLVPAINPQRLEQIEQILANYPASFKQAVQVIHAQDSKSKVGRDVMAASDLVLLASGTATLECLLFGRPMVVVYKLHWLTYLIANFMVKIPYKSLPNILAGRELVPELIQYDATPDKVFQAAIALLQTSKGKIQQEALTAIHQQLQGQQAVDPAVAVLELLNKK
ncbi:lipid-A-disaccharide synthase [Alkanindiges sp. WGS2144]|uniref:lipid-A-disaccharide synthase n=1 Tax=Alkanindiges sp. WGS2144 TaxID=3366808 RepID=UPI003751F240